MLSEDLQALENYVNKMKDKSVLCLFLLPSGTFRSEIQLVKRAGKEECESSQVQVQPLPEPLWSSYSFSGLCYLSLKNCHFRYRGWPPLLHRPLNVTPELGVKPCLHSKETYLVLSSRSPGVKNAVSGSSVTAINIVAFLGTCGNGGHSIWRANQIWNLH